MSWINSLKEMCDIGKVTRLEDEHRWEVEKNEEDESALSNLTSLRFKVSGVNGKVKGRVNEYIYENGYIRLKSNFLNTDGLRCELSEKTGFVTSIYEEGCRDCPKYTMTQVIHFISIFENWVNWEVSGDV